MSTTVTYKGSTIATATNQTKTLETSGTWLEDDITITDVTAAPNLQAKSNIDPTTSSQTIYADVGHDGLSSVQINAMPSGSASPAATLSGTGASASVSGTDLVVTKNLLNSPVVNAGYVAAASAGNTLITLSTPATNLEAGNIKSGISIFGVVGTYTGGGVTDRLVLLKTESLGSLSTTSTTAVTTGKSFSVSSVGGYDLIIVETSVDTLEASKHCCTILVIWLTGSSSVTNKNGSTVLTSKLNMKTNSSKTVSSRQSTTSYGVFPNSIAFSGGTLTIDMYMRYNSTQTGTINGSYTSRVYGINLANLIGG